MDNLFFRYDAEFFNKIALHTDKKIKERSHYFLKYSEIVSGPFGSALKSESYLQTGVPFIRIENIRGGFNINTSNMVYISEQDNNKIGNSQLNVDDIILSKVGNSIGYFARVDENIGTCNISENNIGIKTKNYSDDEKSFILTYLNCKYAKVLVLRRTSGNAQPKLNVSDLCFVPIPSFSDHFHKIVRKVVLDSQNKLFEAENIYGVAEAILQKYLDVSHCFNDDFSVKTLSNSFLQSGRLDAEYYQPKYDIYEQTIKKYPNGCTTINEKFNLVTEKCLRNLSQYRYIEIGDINVVNGSYTYNILNTEELPDNAKIMTRARDILVSTVRPNRGAVAILEEDNLLVSGAFTVLRPKSNYSKEVLQVLLRTIVYRDWLLKFNVGSSYPVIKDSDVLNLPIPLLEENIQKEISDKMQESFRLRKEAQKLLDNAIKAVEMAIETDEETALKCLDNQQTLHTNQNL